MLFMGAFPPTVEHDRDYFDMRHIQLDCRGPLTISRESNWGWFVTVITQSHYIGAEMTAGFSGNGAVERPVTVARLAWIGSGALLYNCTIGEGAIVAAGSVVRSCEVKPWTMVAGNPARVIARHRDGEWEYCEPKWTVLE